MPLSTVYIYLSLLDLPPSSLSPSSLPLSTSLLSLPPSSIYLPLSPSLFPPLYSSFSHSLPSLSLPTYLFSYFIHHLPPPTFLPRSLPSSTSPLLPFICLSLALLPPSSSLFSTWRHIDFESTAILGFWIHVHLWACNVTATTSMETEQFYRLRWQLLTVNAMLVRHWPWHTIFCSCLWSLVASHSNEHWSCLLSAVSHSCCGSNIFWQAGQVWHEFRLVLSISQNIVSLIHCTINMDFISHSSHAVIRQW